eukprot:COSAG05_NODE_19614_length_290_cov_0.801047_1_plen_36_part_10
MCDANAHIAGAEREVADVVKVARNWMKANRIPKDLS